MKKSLAGIAISALILSAGCQPPEIDWYQDADEDGAGNPDVILTQVEQPEGYVVNDTDCDDNNADNYPLNDEITDGQDNDCDDKVDEVDLDADSFDNFDDCDDGDASRFPGNPEICDGIDNDCDLAVPVGEQDNDGDGYVECSIWSGAAEITAGGDCNDADDTIHPNAFELADAIDNDCAGGVDDGVTERYVFVTSALHNGDFTEGGNFVDALDGADALCQDLADASTGTLPAGIYRAWLSTGSVNANAAGRLTHASVPYMKYDDVTQVALTWNELVDGALDSAIDQDENGAVHAADKVWTGTNSAGVGQAAHCGDWSISTESSVGVVGKTAQQDSTWTFDGDETCDRDYRLYCLQQ